MRQSKFSSMTQSLGSLVLLLLLLAADKTTRRYANLIGGVSSKYAFNIIHSNGILIAEAHQVPIHEEPTTLTTRLKRASDYGEWSHERHSHYHVVFPFEGPLGLQLDDEYRVLDFARRRSGEFLQAESCGLIHIGDILMEINGIPVRHLEVHETANLLREISVPRVVTFMAKVASEGVPIAERETAFDFEVELDGNRPLGLNVSEDLVVLGYLPIEHYGLSGNATTQILENGAILVGERILAVDGETLTQMDPDQAISKLRHKFVVQPEEEIICTTDRDTQVCRSMPVQHGYVPRIVTIRPPEVYSPKLLGQILDHKVPKEDSYTPLISSFDEDYVLKQAKNGAKNSSASAAEKEVVAFCSPEECFFYVHHGEVHLQLQRESATGISSVYKTESFAFASALFGGAFPCKPRRVVFAKPAHACEFLTNENQLDNAIVLVWRGVCEFHRKALFVQSSGAYAMLIINNDASLPIRMPIPMMKHSTRDSAEISQRDESIIMDSDASSEEWKIHIASAMISKSAGEWMSKQLEEANTLGALLMAEFGPLSTGSNANACEAARKEHVQSEFLRMKYGFQESRSLHSAAANNRQNDAHQGEDSHSAAKALLQAIMSQSQKK